MPGFIGRQPELALEGKPPLVLDMNAACGRGMTIRTWRLMKWNTQATATRRTNAAIRTWYPIREFGLPHDAVTA